MLSCLWDIACTCDGACAFIDMPTHTLITCRPSPTLTPTSQNPPPSGQYPLQFPTHKAPLNIVHFLQLAKMSTHFVTMATQHYKQIWKQITPLQFPRLQKQGNSGSALILPPTFPSTIPPNPIPPYSQHTTISLDSAHFNLSISHHHNVRYRQLVLLPLRLQEPTPTRT
jgi:hypothetical protein